MGKASRNKAKKRAQSQNVLDRALEMFAAKGHDNVIVQRPTKSEDKISHALVMLLAEEVPEGAPLEEYRAALGAIALAWNMSLLPEDQRPQALHDVIAKFEGPDEAERRYLAALLQRLMARKQALFPHDQRMVISWDASLSGGNLRVTAAATGEG